MDGKRKSELPQAHNECRQSDSLQRYRNEAKRQKAAKEYFSQHPNIDPAILIEDLTPASKNQIVSPESGKMLFLSPEGTSYRTGITVESQSHDASSASQEDKGKRVERSDQDSDALIKQQLRDRLNNERILIVNALSHIKVLAGISGKFRGNADKKHAEDVLKERKELRTHIDRLHQFILDDKGDLESIDASIKFIKDKSPEQHMEDIKTKDKSIRELLEFIERTDFSQPISEPSVRTTQFDTQSNVSALEKPAENGRYTREQLEKHIMDLVDELSTGTKPQDTTTVKLWRKEGNELMEEDINKIKTIAYSLREEKKLDNIVEDKNSAQLATTIIGVANLSSPEHRAKKAEQIAAWRAKNRRVQPGPPSQ